MIAEAGGFAVNVAMAWTGDGLVIPVVTSFEHPVPVVRVAVIDAHTCPTQNTNPIMSVGAVAAALSTISDPATALAEGNQHADHPVSVVWADLGERAEIVSAGRVGCTQLAVTSDDLRVAWSEWEDMDAFDWIAGERPWDQEEAPLGVGPHISAHYTTAGQVPDGERVVVASRSARLDDAGATDIAEWAGHVATTGVPFALLAAGYL